MFARNVTFSIKPTMDHAIAVKFERVALGVPVNEPVGSRGRGLLCMDRQAIKTTGVRDLDIRTRSSASRCGTRKRASTPT